MPRVGLELGWCAAGGKGFCVELCCGVGVGVGWNKHLCLCG